MIDKELLTKTVEDAIAGTDLFLVDIKITPTNDITVEIDSPDGVDIDSCADITRKIENVFDRDNEDYSLEVGSVGLTSPFKVKGQYLKNIGTNIEILTRDGRKIHATLTAVGDDGFTAETPVKIKEPGAKKATTVMQPETFRFDDCKSVRYEIKFK